MSGRLLKSTAIVSSMTMLSRLLGFVRDIVIANLFGAGPATDAFFVAFKIPNFFRRLFAEGAFSQAFVPVVSEYKTRYTLAEVRLLVASTVGTLGAVLLLITVVAVLASPLLVSVFAPGFTHDPYRFTLTAQMLRITFPYLLFISLTAMAAGVLNTYGQFGIPAITPIWLNICLITAAYFLAPLTAEPIVGLAWGVFIAGIAQLVFQFPSLKRLGLLPRPRWGWHDEGVRRVMRLMLPAIFGSSVAQINLLIDTIIASLLAAGSVSWLYYSDRLMEFPLGVFGVALSTVILPSLSKQHAAEDPEAFADTLDWALRWVFIIGVPATVGLVFLATPLLSTLFQHGAFGVNDVAMASWSLMAFGLGLPGFMLVKALAPGYYARQDTRTPVGIGVKAMVANMVINIAIVLPMSMAGVPAPHAGLALATSLAALLNASLLFRGLYRSGAYRPRPGWGGFALRLLIANLVLAAVLWFGSGTTSSWVHGATSSRVYHLFALILGGMAAYFVVLFAVGIRPAQLLGRAQL